MTMQPNELPPDERPLIVEADLAAREGRLAATIAAMREGGYTVKLPPPAPPPNTRYVTLFMTTRRLRRIVAAGIARCPLDPHLVRAADVSGRVVRRTFRLFKPRTWIVSEKQALLIARGCGKTVNFGRFCGTETGRITRAMGGE